jgi:hypothetical protein
MPNAVVQTVPMAIMTFMVATLNGSMNAASLEWQTTGEVPTQCSPPLPTTSGMPVNTVGLTWIAVSKMVSKNSRALEDWQKKDSDEFFWSQFK